MPLASIPAASGSKRSLDEASHLCTDFLGEMLIDVMNECGSNCFTFRITMPMPAVPSLASTSATPAVDARARMMKVAKIVDGLPKPRSTVNMTAKDELHNSILQWLKDHGCGWSVVQVDSIGAPFVRNLCDAVLLCSKDVWKSLNDRKNAGGESPEEELKFLFGNKVTGHKADKPKDYMGTALVSFHSALVGSSIWIKDNSSWDPVLKMLSHLKSLLEKYSDRLEGQRVRQNTQRASLDSHVRSDTDAIETEIFEAFVQGSGNKKTKPRPPELEGLDTLLRQKEIYEPVDLNDFMDGMTVQRRSRFISILKDRKLKVAFQMFSWMRGGSRAGLSIHVIWKVPLTPRLRDENRSYHCQKEAEKSVNKFATRAAKQLFFASTVSPMFIDNKTGAAAVYKYLTGDQLPTDMGKSRTEAIRVAELALASQDFELVSDLRALNGRPTSGKFDAFWEEFAIQLDESMTRVDDRRHGSISYLPLAQSRTALIEKVRRALMAKNPGGLEAAKIFIPSATYVEYQFVPKDSRTAAALNYTGRAQVRRAVQKRTLRCDSIDSHYAAALFKYMRRYGVLVAKLIQCYTAIDKEPAPVVFVSMEP